MYLAERCKVPSPADKIVLAFQELARLVQLTEWPGKEGQPGRAQDSHCVCDEMSRCVALLLHPLATLRHRQTDTHTHAHTHAHHRQAHQDSLPEKNSIKGRRKELQILFLSP